MDPIRDSYHVLDRMIRLGGVVGESSLPYGDALVMFRLTNQDFIKPLSELDTGERIFEITEKGMAEAERHRDRMSH